MARKYVMKRRAERQKETRQRITEAAVELHRTVGPARTTVSAIAEKAGVQRHTYYAHFPELRDLYTACTSHYVDRTPSTGALLSGPRMQTTKSVLGEHYLRSTPTMGTTRQIFANVLRDAEVTIPVPSSPILSSRTGSGRGAMP